MLLPSIFRQLFETRPTVSLRMLAVRCQHGFTVVEMVVTIGVLGILGAMAAVALGSLAPKFDLDNGARAVAMALSQARVQAITRGHTVDVTFGTNAFTITDTSNGEVVAEGELPSHITVSAADNVTFTALGTAAAPLDVTVSNGDNSRLVSVGLTGEVQIQ